MSGSDYYDRPARQRRRRWGLYLPFLAFALLIVAYSAYWAYARNLLADGIEDWIAEERARGMTVEYQAKRLGGYPFRFELAVEAPVYGDARIGERWEGERLELVMQPWNWQHIIARAPGENRITAGGETMRLVLGPRSAGSLSWTDDGIRRASLALDEADAEVNGAPVLALEGFAFHLRPPPGEPETLQVQTQWQRVSLARPVPDAEFLGTEFGPSILRAEATRAFPALETVQRLEDLPRRILDLGGEIRLAQLILDWGPAELGARGEIGQGPAGRLDGNIGLRLERAEELRQALQTAGRLDAETRQAIDALEAASRGGNFLEVSIRDDGLYFLGQNVVPAPLGEML